MILTFLEGSVLSMVLGFIVDMILGDPHWLPHPISFIGKMISGFEKIIRKIVPDTKGGLIFGGVLLVIAVLFCASIIPFIILQIAYRIHYIFGTIVNVYMCWTILATKSLKVESMKVYDALNRRGLEDGRRAVSMIVGRDTKELTEEGVIKAAVETVAENTSDGVIAPIIYMFIGGPVLGYFYKAVNTMDSMVGYKNARYEYFGKAAARLDDVLNYIPSRLSALLMILACYFTSLNAKEAKRIWKRDRRKHASPNSAQTESVMAGALGVQLAGDASYFGVVHHKPFIGDKIREVERENIVDANRLLYATALVAMIIVLILGRQWIIFELQFIIAILLGA